MSDKLDPYKSYMEELERREAAVKAGKPIPTSPLATAMIEQMRALDEEVKAMNEILDRP